MNVKQMLSSPIASTAASKAAAIDRIGRILDDAAADPEKFVRIVRTQLGREERALFTYGHVTYRASRGDVGAMGILEEFLRQERGNDISPEEITDQQLEQLWSEGVSIGRILSVDASKLSAWYQGLGKEGSKPYCVVTHWAKALRVCREMDLSSMVNTLEDLLQVYYERYIPKAPGDDTTTEEGIMAIYEAYHPGFQEAYTGQKVFA